MSVVAAAVFFGGTLLVTSMILMTTLIASSLAQGETMNQAAGLQGERIRTVLAQPTFISSDSGGGTVADVEIENTGAITIVDWSMMDVFIQYTATNNQLTIKRLDYVTSGPGNDQWLVDSISPDGYNPTLWDPDEKVTLKLKAVPPVKTNTTATVVVVTPNGVYTTGTFLHT